MSWAHFHFNCRYLCQQLEAGRTKQQALAELEALDISPFFEEKQLSGSAGRLFEKLISIDDEHKLVSCLRAYLSIDINKLSGIAFESQKRVDRFYYLVTISILFIVIATLFKLFVVTEFVQLYGIYETQLPAQLDTFDRVYLVTMSLIPIFMLLSWIVHRRLTHIDSALVQRDGAYHWLFGKKISEQLNVMSQLLMAPLNLVDGKPLLIPALAHMQSNDANFIATLPSLLTVKSEQLDRQLTLHVRRALIAFETFIYISIGYLIMVMYQPIFGLGQLI
ncbi:hypothetical protein [Thalassotalea maritima]|uniref:hypothetical protein n=1 Tax=Thalassotalea maritima TaxID=3242416 RepID=UPI003528DA33